ncbi:MAG: hypothetical protein NTZ33_10155 [Bacteroidetes bacterium]|nr:hypothetical protein [Bacteroidota bacterium]
MHILIDPGIPDAAKNKLALYGQVIELEKNTVTYNAISSHPDIFCCQTPDNLIVAPNTTSNLIEIFKANNIRFIIGNQNVGLKYPDTTFYNAVITKEFLIHNTKYTDEIIKNNCNTKTQITVKQSYTRCNLLPLGEHHFITSDEGIYKTLNLVSGISILYVNPENIILPDFKNGFFGGCCGIYQNKLFIIGNLSYINESKNIRSFIENAGFQIIELYDGPLFDGGSLLFIEKSKQLIT